MMAIKNNEWIDEIDGWISSDTKHFNLRIEKIRRGEATQATYTGLAMVLLSLGLSKFLRGNPLGEVRLLFRQSAESIETSFHMAYDQHHPNYLGVKADLTEILMTQAIDGFHAALLADDFEICKRLAPWAQIPSDEINKAGDPKHAQSLVANYMHALKYVFLGDDVRALEYARATEKWFETKGEPTKNRFHRNFFHRCRMVRAVLEKDSGLFEASLQVQLKSHAWAAQHDDIADTPEAYIYVDGVALCKLAIHKGLKINVVADTIPKGLLIDP